MRRFGRNPGDFRRDLARNPSLRRHPDCRTCAGADRAGAAVCPNLAETLAFSAFAWTCACVLGLAATVMKVQSRSPSQGGRAAEATYPQWKVSIMKKTPNGNGSGRSTGGKGAASKDKPTHRERRENPSGLPAAITRPSPRTRAFRSPTIRTRCTANARGPTLLEDFHPPREDHALRSRADPRADRARARHRRARVLRAHAIARAGTRPPRCSPRSARRRRSSRASPPWPAAPGRSIRRATCGVSPSSSTRKRETGTWSATTSRSSSFKTPSSFPIWSTP